MSLGSVVSFAVVYWQCDLLCRVAQSRCVICRTRCVVLCAGLFSDAGVVFCKMINHVMLCKLKTKMCLSASQHNRLNKQTNKQKKQHSNSSHSLLVYLVLYRSAQAQPYTVLTDGAFFSSLLSAPPKQYMKTHFIMHLRDYSFYLFVIPAFLYF